VNGHRACFHQLVRSLCRTVDDLLAEIPEAVIMVDVDVLQCVQEIAMRPDAVCLEMERCSCKRLRYYNLLVESFFIFRHFAVTCI
jgi:hypothetical protein